MRQEHLNLQTMAQERAASSLQTQEHLNQKSLENDALHASIATQKSNAVELNETIKDLQSRM